MSLNRLPQTRRSSQPAQVRYPTEGMCMGCRRADVFCQDLVDPLDPLDPLGREKVAFRSNVFGLHMWNMSNIPRLILSFLPTLGN